MDYSSFKDLRTANAPYVDKSLFIQEVLTGGAEASIILRPPGFGKSLNLSMLREFLRLGNDPALFQGLKICEQKEIMEENCGKYPVIYLDLKNVIGPTFESTLWKLWEAVGQMAEEHIAAIEQVYPGEISFELEDFDSQTPSSRKFFLQSILDTVVHALNKHYKREVVVLIDSYNVPLHNAYKEGFFKEVSDLFGSFYSMALKRSDAKLLLSCLTGVGEVVPLGNWNNMLTYTYRETRYSSSFGFTEDEMRQLGIQGSDLESIMELYNGYHFGNAKVMNPRSVTNWQRDGKESTRNGVDAILSIESQEFFKGHEMSTIMEIYALLYDKVPLEINISYTWILYSDSKWYHFLNIANFLILFGYLTYHNGKIMIPNKEIAEYWENAIPEILAKFIESRYAPQVAEVLNKEPFDVKELNGVMKKVFAHIRYDIYRSSVYHRILYQLFLTSLPGSNVSLESKKDVENGRFGIIIKFLNEKKSFILEFKVVEDHDWQQAYDFAFRQIVEADY